jgi:hypothetical protein
MDKKQAISYLGQAIQNQASLIASVKHIYSQPCSTVQQQYCIIIPAEP